MRDTHRMKEKIDISLDNRQMFGLFVAGVVVLGTVFVLGVVVGKKLVVENRVSAAPDLLSTLDAKAAALDRVHTDDQALTFQEELTKKAPVEMAPATTPVPAVNPIPVPESSPVASAPTSASPPPAPPKPQVVAKTEGHLLPPGPSAKPVIKAEENQLPVRTMEKERKPPTAVSSKGPATAGPYTLQVSAAQSRMDAERFIQALRHKGYSAYVVEAQVPGKGTWFRVRLGHFPSKEVAGRYLEDFRRETQMRAYVTSAGE